MFNPLCCLLEKRRNRVEEWEEMGEEEIEEAYKEGNRLVKEVPMRL